MERIRIKIMGLLAALEESLSPIRKHTYVASGEKVFFEGLPPTGSYTCAHCEDMTSLQAGHLRHMPKSLAICPKGYRQASLWEMISGEYDCL